MKRLILLAFSSLVSAVAFAQTCPDLSGVYGDVMDYGFAVEIKQSGCDTMVMTQYHDDGSQVTDKITADGQFRVYNSMPQFETSATYNATSFIFTSNDVNTGIKMRNFIFSLDQDSNLVEETIKYDTDGNKGTDQTGTLPRCPDGQDCTF